MEKNVIVHPMQSYEWESAMKRMNIETFRVYENPEDTSSRSYLVVIKNIPFSDLKIGYLERSTLPTAESLARIHSIAKEKNCIFVHIELGEFITTDVPLKMDSAIRKVLVPAKNNLYDWTVVLDLKKSDDALYKAFSRNTRRNITRAKKKVQIKEMTNSKGFEIFYKLYKETSKRKVFSPYSYEYLHELFKAFQGIVHLFIAFHNDKPVAAFEIFFYNNKLYYPCAGISKQAHKVSAAFLLMWHVIQFGNKIGAESFDMWGSLGPADIKESHSWYGFTQFKLGFGGNLRQYMGSFDLVIHKEIYNTFRFTNIYLSQVKDSGILISDRSYNFI